MSVQSPEAQSVRSLEPVEVGGVWRGKLVSGLNVTSNCLMFASVTQSKILLYHYPAHSCSSRCDPGHRQIYKKGIEIRYLLNSEPPIHVMLMIDHIMA